MDIIKNRKINNDNKKKYFLEQRYKQSLLESEDEYKNIGSDHYEPDYFYQEQSGENDDDSNNNKSKSFLEKLFTRLFVWIVFLLFVLVGGYFVVNSGLKIKKQVLGMSEQASNNVNSAIVDFKKQDFSSSENKFNDSYNDFLEISRQLKKISLGGVFLFEYIPGVSKISTGYYLARAGEQISLAGKRINYLAKEFSDLKNGNGSEYNNQSFLRIFLMLDDGLKNIQINLKEAKKNLKKVNINDLPKKDREKVLDLKNKIYLATDAVEAFSENSDVIADLLGANGPRKYLFLFQNNQEIRATGGFIGSYGILSIDSHGRVQKFFIDGIFNPDGQLLDKIVPPKPIQKISVSWSLHDSNWFPDFPLSARKAMSFYEKTGGPTVDGVIAITPTVMQRLLSVIGPVKMNDYDVILTKDNFVKNIQYEVEENYDKKENRPKKILSDLAPIILNKILSSKDPKVISKTINIFEKLLAEKQIILFSTNKDLQKIISDLGWSGEILQTKKDYLNVINTNINGYKTDGVIDEKIEHQVNILGDGSVVDTVSITRKHNGGRKKYEWWNKVNADYMRVYVPQGSKFLGVEGQTREINKSPVNYNNLGFERDPDVKKEENSIYLDEKTGTRIYNEFGKTVFANWVYVSPQETVTIKYKYLLPFKVSFDEHNPANSYSILVQKQSGSFGSDYSLQINYPKEYYLEWKSDNLKKCSSLKNNNESYCLNAKLITDKFCGLVFSNSF